MKASHEEHTAVEAQTSETAICVTPSGWSRGYAFGNTIAEAMRGAA